MDLKELMGDAYKEGISKEDVQAFFKNQVLSSGEYARKEKTDATEKALKKQVEDLQNELKTKMTDDEKKKAESDDIQKEIEDLKRQLQERDTLISEKTAASALSGIKVKAGIKDNDKEYDEFIKGISFEDNAKTEKISKYISKIISDAYDAGKAETVKNKLGKMGAFKEGSDGNSNEEKGSFGKQLAQSTKVEVKGEKNFFERK